MRADASEIFHRIRQRDAHTFKGSGQLLMVSRNGARRTFIPLSARQVFLAKEMETTIVEGTNFDRWRFLR